MEHHRGHKIICDEFNKVPTVIRRQQLVFYPHDVPFIKWTATEDMRHRIKDLANAIRNFGKKTLRSKNVAETLQVYAETFIAPADKDKPVGVWATGNGVVRWEGPKLIDGATGETLIELQKPDGNQVVTAAGLKHPLLQEDTQSSEGENDSEEDVSEGDEDNLSDSNEDVSEGDEESKRTKCRHFRG
jgi:hypothetical protein